MISTLLAASSSSSSGGSAVAQILFFGAIFAGMYFVLLRPQRKRMRETSALQNSVAVDDEVVLSSGIYGFVTAIEGDVLWLDIADGHGAERIEIRVSRGAVARKVIPAVDKQ